MNPNTPIHDKFRSLVRDAWLPAIKAGESAAKEWESVADDCLFFYAASSGFQFKKAYVERAFATPQFDATFKITLQKIFDIVAIFGPALFAQAPGRDVTPVSRSAIARDVTTGLPFQPQDPQLAELLMMADMERRQQDDNNTIVAQLYQSLLDMSSREFPGGGMETHANRAITDVLVQGRGCLWLETADLPSGGRLVGSEHASPRDLVIDPTCQKLEDALWIARRHRDPIWKVARKFNLSENLFRNVKKAKDHLRGHREPVYEKVSSQGNSPGDMVVWYEVFSKCGAGRRVMKRASDAATALDRVVGDYAYVCVMEGVEFPLNAPPSLVMQEEEEQTVERFQWPVPTWLDCKWPVSVLDLYEQVDKPYPIALAQNGLGLLKLANVLLCVIAEKVWGGAKDILFIDTAYAEAVNNALRTAAQDENVMRVVECGTPEGTFDTLKDAIYAYNAQPIDPNIWTLVSRVLEEFDKTTGLNSLLYGNAGTQSRSSTDAETKQDALSTRPDHYATRVERWLREAANKEKLAARWEMTPEDFGGLYGQYEQLLWENLVTNQPVEAALRDLDVSIRPGAARRPDRKKQGEGMQQIIQYLAPEFSKHADITGNTGPLNSMLARFLDNLDIPADDFQMEPRVPTVAPAMPPMAEEDDDMAL